MGRCVISMAEGLKNLQAAQVGFLGDCVCSAGHDHTRVVFVNEFETKMMVAASNWHGFEAWTVQSVSHSTVHLQFGRKSVENIVVFVCSTEGLVVGP